jgi:hypothetical protein
MNTTTSPPPNLCKAEEAHEAFVQMLVDASQPGFFGTATLSLALQDGVIQNIRVATEKLLK